MTQCDKILFHLQTIGSITPVEALDQYGCFRLAVTVPIISLPLCGFHQRFPRRLEPGDETTAPSHHAIPYPVSTADSVASSAASSRRSNTRQ